MPNMQRIFSFWVVAMIFLSCGKTQSDSSKAYNEQVEIQLNNRMDYFIQLYGSKENLEKTTGKSFDKIKEENRPIIKQQMIAEHIIPTKEH